MATKKVSTKKRTKAKSRAKTVPMRSFKIAPRQQPFMVFKFTDQTLYWIIIGSVVIAVGLYLASLQMQIHSLYDQVNMHDSQSNIDMKSLDRLQNQAMQDQ